MVIKRDQMETEVRTKMRDGQGDISITHLVKKDELKNARLLANIKIPIGASIGDHEHDKETEYYILTRGKGVVVDNGAEKEVEAGDVIVTGSGASHSIKNSGNVDLDMIAVIITY